MLLFQPLLLLGDINGLLWLLGVIMIIAFVALVLGIVVIGKKTFVANATTEVGKSNRMTVLAVIAPFLAIIVLWLILML